MLTTVKKRLGMLARLLLGRPVASARLSAILLGPWVKVTSLALLLAPLAVLAIPLATLARMLEIRLRDSAIVLLGIFLTSELEVLCRELGKVGLSMRPGISTLRSTLTCDAGVGDTVSGVTGGVGDGVGKLGKGDVIGGVGSTVGGVGKVSQAERPSARGRCMLTVRSGSRRPRQRCLGRRLRQESEGQGGCRCEGGGWRRRGRRREEEWLVLLIEWRWMKFVFSGRRMDRKRLLEYLLL